MSDDLTIAASTLRDTHQDPRDMVACPAALLAVAGDPTGTIFDLDRDDITIGRSVKTDIQLEFAGISRRHCLLRADGNSHTLHDSGSKNGTFVNDVRVTAPVVLHKGDLVRVGPVVFQYLPKGDPERQAYERLDRRAKMDGFTGCYNKSYFNERAELEVRACKAGGGELSLILFDLDHFKRLNDCHGHDAGDFVLKELSGLIQANGMRQQDVLARFGGEEFVILLPGTELATGVEIAERQRLLVAEHLFLYDGQRLPVTVSVGVAACDDDMATGADLFRAADAALYVAKQAGRNRIRAHRTNPRPGDA